ncbi:MAG: hypothetical protein PSV36_01165 [Algoriphagus sp.]|nr:hypothetical protein [Algoriphagus sp.]
MQLLISLLPFLLRLTLVFQGPALEAVAISPSDLIAFSEDLNTNGENLHLFSSEPNFPQLARKLETEEKEIDFLDLFIDSSFQTTSFYYVADTSLFYVDYRKTRNNPHLYDLFHSWKTHLS